MELEPLIVSPGRKNPLPCKSLYAILNTLRFSFSTYPPSFRAAPVGTALSDPAPIAVVTCDINVWMPAWTSAQLPRPSLTPL